MRKIFALHLLAYLFASCSIDAKAFDYDVDMPPSGNPKYDVVRISIDGCDTIFKIPKKELTSFAKNLDSTISQDMIDKAIAHKTSGCKH